MPERKSPAKSTKPKMVNRGAPGLLSKKDSGEKPKMTNRGGAGLLSKVKHEETNGDSENGVAEIGVKKAKHQIAPALKHLIVDIDCLTPDPNNARLHPDRNLQAIKDSLTAYGQTIPLVVRKATNVIVAGNGRWEAAKALGWKKIAATFVDMNEVEAAGFGLADNRSAELASWDFEVVARLDKLCLEAGHPSIGWSRDELEVLRMADWTPPPASDEEFGNGPIKIEITETLQKAIERIRDQRMEENDLTEIRCLEIVCLEWMGEKC